LTTQAIPWGVTAVQAPQVWNRATGSNVKFHIIDSGLRVVSDITYSNQYHNGAGFDDWFTGDGTLVASVGNATNNSQGIVGVAYDAALHSGTLPQNVND